MRLIERLPTFPRNCSPDMSTSSMQAEAVVNLFMQPVTWNLGGGEAGDGEWRSYE